MVINCNILGSQGSLLKGVFDKVAYLKNAGRPKAEQ